MGFLGDRTVGHRARLESLNDALGGLNFVDADAAVFGELELERAPQSDVSVFPVDRVRKLLEQFIIAGPCCLPQKRDRLGVVEVIFLVGSLLVRSNDTQRIRGLELLGIESFVMQSDSSVFNILERDASDAADRIREVFIHQFFADAECLEDLGALIGLDRGDTHFRAYLYDAVNDGLRISGARFGIVLVDLSLADKLVDRVKSEIWVDCARTESHERCKMMNVARLARLQNDRDRRIHSRSYEMCLKRRNRKQRRDRYVVLVDSAVGQDEYRGALFVRPVSLLVKAVDRVLE